MLFWCFSVEPLTLGCRGSALLTGFHIKETQLPQCLCRVWIRRARRATCRCSTCGGPEQVHADLWGAAWGRRMERFTHFSCFMENERATSVDDHWKDVLWIGCRCTCTCTSSARNAASPLVSCSLITTATMSASRQLPNHREHVLPILNN